MRDDLLRRVLLHLLRSDLEARESFGMDTREVRALLQEVERG